MLFQTNAPEYDKLFLNKLILGLGIRKCLLLTDRKFKVELLSDFINLTQVHNFTVSAQDIFTFRRLSVFTVSFARILQVLMQIMKRFPLYY